MEMFCHAKIILSFMKITRAFFPKPKQKKRDKIFKFDFLNRCSFRLAALHVGAAT